MGLFSFVYIFRNLLFTGKQKKITNFLMARIKAFEVPNIFWLKKIQKKPKNSFFSFVYFFTNYLFTGKQMKILKLLVANMEATEVPNNSSAQIFFLNQNQARYGIVFFCLHF